MAEFRADTGEQLSTSRSLTTELERQLQLTRELINNGARLERLERQRDALAAGFERRLRQREQASRGFERAPRTRLEDRQARNVVGPIFYSVAGGEEADTNAWRKQRDDAARQREFDARFEKSIERLKNQRLARLQGTSDGFTFQRQAGNVLDVLELARGRGNLGNIVGATELLGTLGSRAGLGTLGRLAAGASALAGPIGLGLAAGKFLIDDALKVDAVNDVGQTAFTNQNRLSQLTRGRVRLRDLAEGTNVFQNLSFVEGIKAQQSLQADVTDVFSRAQSGPAYFAAQLNAALGEQAVRNLSRTGFASLLAANGSDPAFINAMLKAGRKQLAHQAHEEAIHDRFELNPTALAESRNREQARREMEAKAVLDNQDWNPN
ncbi:MAG: hypothetical protein HS116_18525 [Planctomycetes bacterium]|nr:hypothetical protein [Planctomycetota bacterium]